MNGRRRARIRPREWFYAVRIPAGKLSSKAHLFVNSIAVCSVNYAAGTRAGVGSERCRNCLRLKDAEVFR
ncbi:MAG: hypothetical protein ACRD1Z_21935 [Vicinamibacteria bacterium]